MASQHFLHSERLLNSGAAHRVFPSPGNIHRKPGPSDRLGVLDKYPMQGEQELITVEGNRPAEVSIS